MGDASEGRVRLAEQLPGVHAEHEGASFLPPAEDDVTALAAAGRVSRRQRDRPATPAPADLPERHGARPLCAHESVAWWDGLARLPANWSDGLRAISMWRLRGGRINSGLPGISPPSWIPKIPSTWRG